MAGAWLDVVVVAAVLGVVAVVIAVVEVVGGSTAGVFCASITGAGAGDLSAAGAITGPCAMVEPWAAVELFDSGTGEACRAIGSFAVVVVGAMAVVAGGGAIDVAAVSRLAVRLVASVEISARTAAAADVSLSAIDAIITVA